MNRPFFYTDTQVSTKVEWGARIIIGASSAVDRFPFSVITIDRQKSWIREDHPTSLTKFFCHLFWKTFSISSSVENPRKILNNIVFIIVNIAYKTTRIGKIETVKMIT